MQRRRESCQEIRQCQGPGRLRPRLRTEPLEARLQRWQEEALAEALAPLDGPGLVEEWVSAWVRVPPFALSEERPEQRTPGVR